MAKTRLPDGQELSFCLPPHLLAPLYEKPSGLFGNRSALSFFPSVAQLPARSCMPHAEGRRVQLKKACPFVQVGLQLGTKSLIPARPARQVRLIPKSLNEFIEKYFM